jgi:hypothetical protein
MSVGSLANGEILLQVKYNHGGTLGVSHVKFCPTVGYVPKADASVKRRL